jgi:protocatechuate 3,4-dioxygenase beta subunit
MAEVCIKAGRDRILGKGEGIMRQILAVTALFSLLAGALRAEPIEKAVVLCRGLPFLPTIALTGRIVDRESRPVAGAEVLLMTVTMQAGDGGWRSYQRLNAFSDAAGRFRFESAGVGMYQMEVRRRGFAPAWREGTAGTGTRGVADLGDLALEPGAVIEGRITDLHGAPVEGAEVRFSESERTRSSLIDRENKPLTTGPDGLFRLEDLENGRSFSFHIRHPGYVPARAPGVEAPTAEPLHIELRPGRSLPGRVLDPERRPVAGAGLFRIEASPRGRSVLQHAETDGEGRFLLSGLEPGPLSLEVRAPGHRTLQLPNLRISDEEDPEPLEILVEPGAVLEGRVLDSRGEPLPRAHVKVFLPDSSRNSRSDHADEKGHYRIDGLGPGEHRLEAQPWPPFSSRRAEGRIVLGETGTHRLDLRMPAGIGVSGRVLDENGEPLAEAWISLVPPGSPRHALGARSTADGSFRIDAVPDGVYRLFGSTQSHTQMAEPDEVSVAGREIDGLVIRLGRGATITGHILGAAEDLRDLFLEARPEGAAEPYTMGDLVAKGVYRIAPLMPGTWQVTASLPSGLSATGTVRVNAGEEAVLDLEMPRGHNLTGRVLLDGRPLPGAQVIGHLPEGSQDPMGREPRTATRHDGSFELRNLRPGRLFLVVSDRAVVHSESLDLSADREVTVAILSGRISGHVLAATGEPIERATISLRRDPELGAWSQAAQAGTDETGAFEVPRLAAASYRITVTREGFGPASQTVTVTPGGATEVQVVLEMPSE